MPDEVLDLFKGDGDESVFFEIGELFRRTPVVSRISVLIICSAVIVSVSTSRPEMTDAKTS